MGELKEFSVLPDTIEEAIEMLKTFFVKSIPQIEKMTEKEFVNSSHFNAGMFIRNSWQLWWHEGHEYKDWNKTIPNLNKQFNDIGIYHADDMSAILMTSMYRSLHKKDLELEEQTKVYFEHWKNYGFPDGIFKFNKEE